MTPEREAKFKQVLARRQPDLTVVMEDIHDPHNISAILRSCDAVGILEVYVINTVESTVKKLGKKSSASAKKWIKVHYFNTVEACVIKLKQKGFTIWSTHLSADAKELYALDLAQPVALAFGNEHKGVSEELLSHSDGNFIIPMMGMIPSLNVSVACAVSLYEAYRQRAVDGIYNEPKLSVRDMNQIYEDWKQD